MLEPDGPLHPCEMLSISHGRVSLRVGELPVPPLFVLALTPKADVRRACLVVWRQGHVLGARFLHAKELRRIARPRIYIDPIFQKIKTRRERGW